MKEEMKEVKKMESPIKQDFVHVKQINDKLKFWRVRLVTWVSCSNVNCAELSSFDLL